ncbi:NAD(P)-dependent oxidoreductase [Heyndrickxia acidicola]|uniref:NAD(P)-dependent oxidoreductase n=1 Tax=Heyndrickxia acidicola TaxID=209389 RepID=A0ABU6MII6_9BACI|nr:NAD(P)-dependent oxidoreductase [Heyndrickxia acidicola]MED1204264.1 NAD(P)-dependent oxidoreductase [Heyndrickxia acidicola]
MENKSVKVGFIGTGVMGKSMAGHLMDAGNELFVYNRTKEKAAELLNKGAQWCSSPAEVASRADIIFTIVGYPQDVEETYLGSKGIIPHAKAGLIVVDMTTSTPTLAKKIYEEAKKHDIYALDAPVSGGDIGAQKGTLTIMAGGDQEVFDKVRPLFAVMGQNIVYQGAAGSGQHTKMANQIAIASNMMGVTEAIVYAKKAGLDPETVLKSISAGAAGSWSLTNLAPRMLIEDYSPGFFIKHFIKDMGIALNESEKMGLELPGLSIAKKLYDELAEKGNENDGTQALIKYWL